MKHFKLKVIGYLVIILACLLGFAFIFGDPSFVFTQLVLIALVSFLVWQLFKHINQTNQKLSSFLLAIKYQDGSMIFPETKDSMFNQLHASFNYSIKKIQQQKEEVKTQEKWAFEFISKLPLGIILCNAEHDVLYYNQCARQLLDTPIPPFLKDIDLTHTGLSHKFYNLSNGVNTQIKLEDGSIILVQKNTIDLENNTLYILKDYDTKEDLELEAWMNLMNVLTHEIMNSITAISSLAKNIKHTVHEDVQQTLELINRIEKRSDALIQFTEHYRTVNSVATPQFKWFKISELIEEQIQLMKNELGHVIVKISGDKSITINADRDQMAQVIINLMLNAIHALNKTDPAIISIKFEQKRKHCHLEFSDNGVGIKAENKNKVFVPFYTSRKNGKGIGLSICRQLMRKNNGSISLLDSQKGKTSWLLRWKIES